MKSASLVLLAAIALSPAPLFAQSDMIIKQKAKDLRNANDAQENARRAAPNPAPAPAPAPKPATPPVTTQVDAELKENLDKLGTDLGAIKSDAAVAPELRDALQSDLTKLAKGSIRPSNDSLTKLTDDLTAALSAPGVGLRESGQLAQSLNVIINSSMVTAAQAQSFIVTAQTTLKNSKVPDAVAKTLTDDLKAILDEVQKKKPKLYQ